MANDSNLANLAYGCLQGKMANFACINIWPSWPSCNVSRYFMVVRSLTPPLRGKVANYCPFGNLAKICDRASLAMLAILLSGIKINVDELLVRVG